jgi:hypothetical protein
MTPSHFVESLGALVFENAFNPYSNRCPVHDLDDAPKRRSNTLQGMLEVATTSEIDALWIRRDLGYRGGRRTGLALTDDVHLYAHAKRWGVSVKRPTRGEVVAERTAAVIWNILSRIEASVFLWNVFPLHPHECGDPFSNRPHNSHERRVGEEILFQLMLLLKPRRLIAIGSNAAKTASHLADNHQVVQVRHPSYGGRVQFLKQIKELYILPENQSQASLW